MSLILCSETHALVSLWSHLQHSYLVISCPPSGYFLSSLWVLPVLPLGTSCSLSAYFLFSLWCHHNVGTTGVPQNAQKYGQAYNGVCEGPHKKTVARWRGE